MPNVKPTPSASSPVPESSLFDRILAYAIVAFVMLSVASFVAVIIGTQSGAGENDGFSQGLWPTVLIFPLFALPIAFLLLVVLLIRGVSRRSRLAQGR